MTNSLEFHVSAFWWLSLEQGTKNLTVFLFVILHVILEYPCAKLTGATGRPILANFKAHVIGKQVMKCNLKLQVL